MPFRSMFVSPGAFRRQMAMLRALGYTGLSLRDAMPYIRGEKCGRVVALTFDDGFVNNIAVAAPVLRRYGFTATNFIVTNQIGGSNLWDQPIGIVKTPCMNLPQLRDWVDQGNEIGSHTLDHVHLPELSSPDARKQIIESRAVLENLLNIEVTSFAYPYGEYSEVHRDFVHQAGYQCCVTIQRGIATKDDDPLDLPRRIVRHSDHLLQVMAKLWRRRRH